MGVGITLSGALFPGTGHVYHARPAADRNPAVWVIADVDPSGTDRLLQVGARECRYRCVVDRRMGRATASGHPMTIADPNLRRGYRDRLLAWARTAADSHLTTAGLAPIPPIEGTWGGVFVTLRRGEILRGCRGMFAPIREATEAVRQATVLALTDPRFANECVTAAELPKLAIEISLLSDPAPTDDPRSLRPGLHGIIVRRGERSGCFLPKVASERGWDAEAFLSNCCKMKAGLDPGDWREPDTQVLLFTADAFAEHDGG